MLTLLAELPIEAYKFKSHKPPEIYCDGTTPVTVEKVATSLYEVVPTDATVMVVAFVLGTVSKIPPMGLEE
jgi:hypothetical protein